MRPTDIKLKTPRDQTPGPKYFFNITSSGKNLSYSKIFKDKKGFSTEKRFKNYDALAKRTCDSVGPGSYLSEKHSFIRNSLSKSTIKYLPTQKKYDSTKTNFYMVGNLLVSDDNIGQNQTKKRNKVSRSFSSKKIKVQWRNDSPKRLLNRIHQNII